MQEHPLVSIIIPTYNRAHLLGETLDSVLAQTYTNWECIVVDDGSTDNTKSLMQTYIDKDKRFLLFDRPDNFCKGANSSRHFGYLKSNGFYINWFDSDDLMHAEHLERKVKAIEKDNLDFVVCKVARFTDNLKHIIPVNNLYNDKDVENQFCGLLTLFTSGPLWRKSFLEKKRIHYRIDGVNTLLNDWVFGLEALLHSKHYKFIKEVLLYYRSHSISIYSSRQKQTKNVLLDEFKIRQDMFFKLINAGYNSNSVYIYYFHRLLYIIRTLIKQGYNKEAIKIFMQFLKVYWFRIKFMKLVRIIIGFILIIFFNRGYDLIKFRES